MNPSLLFGATKSPKTPSSSKKARGKPGGAAGLSFGNQYENFIGGLDGFCYFLSTGFESWDKGKDIINELKDLPEDRFEKIWKGERYKKISRACQEIC